MDSILNKKIVIFGNSGSGKSTLAKELQQTHDLQHLDLDLIAWLPTSPPQRKPLEESKKEIDAFISANEQWVIEGCYSDLLALLLPSTSELIYMNLPVDACITNAKNRHWEPHKYASKEAQDANLNMLIDWIAQYDQRDDTFSQAAHENLFKSYNGTKTMYLNNERLKQENPTKQDA